jgi:hypothetical protein
MSFRHIQGDGIEVDVKRNVDGKIYVNGQITKYGARSMTIRWIAAKEPHRCTSFSGSGLPYHNADQAFHNTPNKGLIKSSDGSFAIVLSSLPSAYYTGLGSAYVPPAILFEIKTNKKEFKTHIFLSPEGMPYRWISGAPSGSRIPPSADETGRAMFYNGREELGLFQNQEALLRFRGYPAKETEGLPDVIDARPWVSAPPPN